MSMQRHIGKMRHHRTTLFDATSSRIPPSRAAVAACAAAVAAVAVFGVDAQAPEPRSAAAGDAVNGGRLFYEHACYGCHGFNGETGARDLVGTNSPLIADVETFITFLRLRADQAPLFPSTRMPNYSESALSDDDARDIYAYVSSFELNAPDVDDVPALRAILDLAERPDDLAIR